jgi:hypothetical protein
MADSAPPRAGVDVLSLILVLLLVWFVLTVVLAMGTLFFQAYIYTEPTEGMMWRAPAAATGIMLTILLWAYLDYQHPGRYGTLWEFSPTEDTYYKSLIVPRRDGKEDVYKKVARQRGGYEYMGSNFGDRPIPSRPDKVIAVTEDGERIAFEPDRDAKGKFKTVEGQSLVYRSATGEVMEEGQLGSVRKFFPGRLFLNLFLNFLHLVAWFACLWLLLRFQWSHAFGLAVAIWVVMILFILPQVLDRTERVAKPTGATGARTVWRGGERNLLDGSLPTV